MEDQQEHLFCEMCGCCLHICVDFHASMVGKGQQMDRRPKV